ncbi:hypothetical protein E2C01_067484 [Portunus trituberculatus]|uniref:Uncharacterized protein n=1 Tax=Portunus trituberculatus TaxID=210409 RepID=A0A5B7HTV8_PORTR|nr:hypothetical protein [Portunus trituberculatus]
MIFSILFFNSASIPKPITSLRDIKATHISLFQLLFPSHYLKISVGEVFLSRLLVSIGSDSPCDRRQIGGD